MFVICFVLSHAIVFIAQSRDFMVTEVALELLCSVMHFTSIKSHVRLCKIHYLLIVKFVKIIFYFLSFYVFIFSREKSLI